MNEPERSQKKKGPLFAFIFNFLVPGLGFTYCGSIPIAIINIMVIIIGYLLICNVLIFSYISFMISTISFIVIQILFSTYALITAVRNKTHSEKKYRSLISMIINIVFIIIVFVILYYLTIGNFFRYKAFQTPSEANTPVLLVGDRFVADMNYYQHNKLKPGDLVVCKYEKDPRIKYRFHRVLAIGPGVLDYKDRTFYLNDKKLEDKYANWSGYEPEKINDPENELQLEHFNKSLNLGDEDIFVVGDNRGGSIDSRSTGPIERKMILGKALYIFQSRDVKRNGNGL